MWAGKFNQRITIEQNSPVQNSMGELTAFWTTLATVWAEVLPLRGRENFNGDQVIAVADTRFRIRHRAGLDNSMRIVYRENVYNIHSILEIGRREGLDILTSVNNPLD